MRHSPNNPLLLQHMPAVTPRCIPPSMQGLLGPRAKCTPHHAGRGDAAQSAVGDGGGRQRRLVASCTAVVACTLPSSSILPKFLQDAAAL